MPSLEAIVRWFKNLRAERKRKLDAGELCPNGNPGCDGTQCDDCLTDWQI